MQDTGNKVILQFVKRVLAKSLHPMVDVLSLLVWKHLEACFISSYKPWCQDSSSLQEIKATWIADFQALKAVLGPQVERHKLVLVLLRSSTSKTSSINLPSPMLRAWYCNSTRSKETSGVPEV